MNEAAEIIRSIRECEGALLDAIKSARAKGFRVEMIYFIPSSELPKITIVPPGLRETVFEVCP